LQVDCDVYAFDNTPKSLKWLKSFEASKMTARQRQHFHHQPFLLGRRCWRQAASVGCASRVSVAGVTDGPIELGLPVGHGTSFSSVVGNTKGLQPES
jgi:hypothetical protein